MESRGRKKMPRAHLEKIGSSALRKKRWKEVRDPVPGEYSLVPAIGEAPTPDQVLPVLAAAVKLQGLESPAHDLTIWHLSEMICDMQAQRQRWRDYIANNPPGEACYHTEQKLLAGYTALETRVFQELREFGMTPASIMNIPNRQPKTATTQEADDMPLEPTL